MDAQKKILIIDDDPQTAEPVRDYLKDQGYLVALSMNGRDGMETLKAHPPDLVVLDLYLPDMKGWDVSSWIRSNPGTKHIPVILCTAKSIGTAEKTRGFQSGVDDFLVRPFELKELVLRIEAILRRAQAPAVPHDVLKELNTLTQKPIPTEPVNPPSPASSPSQPAPASESSPPQESSGLSFFKRLFQILVSPKEVFSSMDSHHDFLAAVLIVLAIPLVGSLGLWNPGPNLFDAWVGQVSLGLASGLLVWLGVGGMIQMIGPFLGEMISTRRALVLAGLASAPSLVGALLSSVYYFIQKSILGGGDKAFSAGVDLIPGLSGNDFFQALGRISVFDAWTLLLVLTGLTALAPGFKPKKSPIAIIVGVVILLFGAFTRF